MLIGAVASHSSGTPGGTPGWIEAMRAPSNDLPIAAVQFFGSNAWAGGEEVALSSLMTGFTFETIDAGGLPVLAANSNRPVAAGALLAALSGAINKTVVIHVTGITAGNDRYLMVIYSEGETSVFECWGVINAGNVEIGFKHNQTTDAGIASAVNVGGEAKIAMNINSTALRGSVNGSSVVGPPETPSPIDMAYVLVAQTFAGENVLEGYIKSVAVYSTQPDASLDELSSL
jgi:hypothetical protein